MHRTIRVLLGAAIGIAMVATTLLPQRVEDARALDFWDWEGAPGMYSREDGHGGGTRPVPQHPGQPRHK